MGINIVLIGQFFQRKDAPMRVNQKKQKKENFFNFFTRYFCMGGRGIF